MVKKLYWLKLKKDFFKDREIKKLRRIAGGDTYTMIYLKLLLLSLDHDGIIFYEGIEDNFEDEMSLELDESYENVKFTIQYLIRRGLMLKINNSEYQMSEAKRLTVSESESTERVRRYRERLRLKPLQCNEFLLHGNSNETFCNTEIEKEKEKEKEKHMCDSPVLITKNKKQSPALNYDFYRDAWNACLMPKVISLNNERRKKLAVRNRDDIFRTRYLDILEKIRASDFLQGLTGNKFRATFDWIISNETNYVKVLEGNYDNSKNTASEIMIPKKYNN